MSTPQQRELKIPIRDIVFHTTLLVPSRIEVQAEFTLPSASLASSIRRWILASRSRMQKKSANDIGRLRPRLRLRARIGILST